MTGLQGLVRGVGAVSVGLGALAVLAPRRLTAAAGVRSADDDLALPVLVRFAAARQIAVGFALLTRSPVDVRRSAGLFLPLTAVDAAAALVGVRGGVLAPRAGAMASAVLAANAAIALAARRQPEVRGTR